jgi:hypothetical protein
MSNEETTAAPSAETTAPDGADDVTETDEALDLISFDLNNDGKISPLEGARQEIGLVDAHMEELAREPGIKGKLADAAHHVLDKLDND